MNSILITHDQQWKRIRTNYDKKIKEIERVLNHQRLRLK